MTPLSFLIIDGAQDGPNWPSRAPKRAPRESQACLQNCPKKLQEAPRPPLLAFLLYADPRPSPRQLSWATFLDGLVGIREASRIVTEMWGTGVRSLLALPYHPPPPLSRHKPGGRGRGGVKGTEFGDSRRRLSGSAPGSHHGAGARRPWPSPSIPRREIALQTHGGLASRPEKVVPWCSVKRSSSRFGPDSWK